MITKRLFGTTETGEEVFLYTLNNGQGMSVSILSFGGAVQSITVPDRHGNVDDVVCGFDTLDSYRNADGYLGALVGRTCNRMAFGRFSLDGTDYRLFCNNGFNSLHGGKVGFSHRIWKVTEVDGEEPALILSLTSPDGEENYPGRLSVTVTYTLKKENALAIRYCARTDRKTIVNLTNHAYFNLAGYASGTIYSHKMRLDADRYLPVNENLIPTGQIKPVTGTPFDFRIEKTIGKDFDLSDSDLAIAGGYDHCLCFSGGETKEPILRGEVYEETTGRRMRLYSTQPCVQFYTGNFMGDPAYPLKGGIAQTKQGAFCLETQKMPDSPNHKNFTDITLEPNAEYDHTTVFAFSVDS